MSHPRFHTWTVDAAISAAGDLLMISCKSFFRINLLAWKATNASARSQSTQHTKKCYFPHDLSYEHTMDVENARLEDMKRGKRKPVKQWRAVSTQSSYFELNLVKNVTIDNGSSHASGDEGELQIRLENTHHATSSTNVAAKCENIYSEDVNEPVHLDSCLRIEDSNKDSSSDGKLLTLEKHSMSMMIGQSLMRFIIGKGGGTKEEIEEKTGVKIMLPPSRKEDSIIIEGNSVESVTKASEKIQSIIDKAVNNRALDYSHFVSLPLAIHPGLVDKLINFQNTILQIVAYDDGKNPDSDATRDNGNMVAMDQQSTEAPKIDVVNAEKDDANIDVNIKSDQHSTKASAVTVELKNRDPDALFKVNTINIPLVSYNPKKSKTSSSKPSSSKSRDNISCEKLGIEKSIFINPKTFHLTILMLKLWNKERVDEASEVLRSISSRVMDALDNRPVSIKLKGLDCMKGSPAKARLLYAPVEEIGGENLLLRASQVIIDAFAEAGLLTGTDAQQKLKLHATIMNARHRRRKLDSFDARGIFDRYGCEEWGEYPILEAHLSQRFVFDENGYYHCCASIPFPHGMQVE